MSWFSDQVPFEGWNLQPPPNLGSDDHASLPLDRRADEQVPASSTLAKLPTYHFFNGEPSNGNSHSHFNQANGPDFTAHPQHSYECYNSGDSAYAPAFGYHATVNENFTTDTSGFPTACIHGQVTAPLNAIEHNECWLSTPHNDICLPVETIHYGMLSGPFDRNHCSVGTEVSTSRPFIAPASEAGLVNGAASLHSTTIDYGSTLDPWWSSTVYLNEQSIASPRAHGHDVCLPPGQYEDVGLPINIMHDSSLSRGFLDEHQSQASAEVSMLPPFRIPTSGPGLTDQMIGESFITGAPRDLPEMVDVVSDDANDMVSQGNEQSQVDVESTAGQHGNVRDVSAKICDECGESFTTHTNLVRHAQVSKHSAYRCRCLQRFSRLDVLERHLKDYQVGNSRYPCPHCRLHRGAESFKRKEHLTQHLRGYHGKDVAKEASWRLSYLICSHTDCPWHRGPAFEHLRGLDIENTGTFQGTAEYTQHMRKVHDESPYPCSVPYCAKTGGKGYFRELDLKKHHDKMHSGVAYSICAMTTVWPCLIPECSRGGENGYTMNGCLVNSYWDSYELRAHYLHVHGYDMKIARMLSNFRFLMRVKQDIE